MRGAGGGLWGRLGGKPWYLKKGMWGKGGNWGGKKGGARGGGGGFWGGGVK